MQVLHRFLVVQKQLKVYLIINQKEFNYMEYTAGLFANFLTKLISLDKDVKSTILKLIEKFHHATLKNYLNGMKFRID